LFFILQFSRNFRVATIAAPEISTTIAPKYRHQHTNDRVNSNYQLRTNVITTTTPKIETRDHQRQRAGPAKWRSNSLDFDHPHTVTDIPSIFPSISYKIPETRHSDNSNYDADFEAFLINLGVSRLSSAEKEYLRNMYNAIINHNQSTQKPKETTRKPIATTSVPFVNIQRTRTTTSATTTKNIKRYEQHSKYKTYFQGTFFFKF
jgi:hypothetical protein